MAALVMSMSKIGGIDNPPSVFNGLETWSLGTYKSFLLPATFSLSKFYHTLIDSKHTLLGMSDYRNNPASQYQSPPPRCGCGLEHPPTHNSNEGTFNEQTRTRYEATHDFAQSTTSQLRRPEPLNNPPYPQGQHSMLQGSNHGSPPPRGLSHGTECLGRLNNQAHDSASLMSSLGNYPSQTNDCYGLSNQHGMVRDRPLNDVNLEPWPPRLFGREGNNANTNYSSSSQSRDRDDQGPQNFAYYPPAAASGMPHTRDKPPYEGVYPSGHTNSCSCPECIAVTTARLDREKAEREAKKSGKMGSRSGDRHSYNDGPSKYRDSARQPPQMDDRYEQQRSLLNEPYRPSDAPLSPLIARPYPPQSNNRSVRTPNIDLGIANLIIDADAPPPPLQWRPDTRRRQRLDNRRRTSELLGRDSERWG
jgi:hypothetical protein